MSWDDDHWDDEYDSDAFDDETATVSCANCGTDVYEDAPSCPVCGEYVTHSTHPFTGRPRWWVIAGVIGMVLTSLALIAL